MNTQKMATKYWINNDKIINCYTIKLPHCNLKVYMKIWKWSLDSGFVDHVSHRWKSYA